MAIIRCRIVDQPPVIEIDLAFPMLQGNLFYTHGYIDTAAEISLFPNSLLSLVEYTFVRQITVEQAGISAQGFSAVEAITTLNLQDVYTGEMVSVHGLAWFADTHTYIVGMKDILEHAIMYMDIPQRYGYLQFANQPPA